MRLDIGHKSCCKCDHGSHPSPIPSDDELCCGFCVDAGPAVVATCPANLLIVSDFACFPIRPLSVIARLYACCFPGGPYWNGTDPRIFYDRDHPTPHCSGDGGTGEAPFAVYSAAVDCTTGSWRVAGQCHWDLGFHCAAWYVLNLNVDSCRPFHGTASGYLTCFPGPGRPGTWPYAVTHVSRCVGTAVNVEVFEA